MILLEFPHFPSTSSLPYSLTSWCFFPFIYSLDCFHLHSFFCHFLLCSCYSTVSFRLIFSFTSSISLLFSHPFPLPPRRHFCLLVLWLVPFPIATYHFLPFSTFLPYLNLLLTRIFSLSLPLQRGGGRLPASAASGPGGEWADGDSEGEGGDVAGGVSAYPHPDQWSADPHPPGTAGLGWHRSTSHGEEWVVEL